MENLYRELCNIDMNGASLTIVDLDDEIKELLSEPAVPIGMKNY